MSWDSSRYVFEKLKPSLFCVFDDIRITLMLRSLFFIVTRFCMVISFFGSRRPLISPTSDQMIFACLSSFDAQQMSEPLCPQNRS